VEVAVEYTVHVPRHILLKHINTVNGTLRVKDLESLGDLRTVNGNIEVYESSGNLHARTTNGNVYVELKHPAICLVRRRKPPTAPYCWPFQRIRRRIWKPAA